ncbi:MAG TPA: efflux RND transporter periplasmic adaptor subunit [Bacteroidales bacterium]|nr:efflux RND transporter periplasmic adaptor subunit [Bacteroidales bacterium]
MMKRYIHFLIILSLSACNRTESSQQSPSYSVRNDTLDLLSSEIYQDKINTDTVTSEGYKMKFSISGIVKAIPNSYAEIASPFSGRIIRSFVRLGQKVEIGSPVFEISSPSFFEAGKTYYQSKQEMQLAEKNLLRQKDLLSNGVGVQKDLEEAEVSYELAKRDYENSSASLGVYHVKPDELVLGQPLIVRSPIKGEIVEDNIVIGQYLKDDAAPVAIVAELSKVWVAGQLKEKDLKALKESDEVEVMPTGIPELRLKGTVYHISEMLDEETRSVQVFIECSNSERMLKPGMYVTAEFSENTGKSILIPSEAVFQSGGSTYVFLNSGKNRFVRHSVEVKGTDRQRVIIASGLSDGDIIITRGGSILLEAK